MADDPKQRSRSRADETSELSLGELNAFEPPTGEIAVDELEAVRPPPPPPVPSKPTPGLGRPKKPEKSERAATTTLKSVPPPAAPAVRASAPPAAPDDLPTTKRPATPPKARSLPPPPPGAEARRPGSIPPPRPNQPSPASGTPKVRSAASPSASSPSASRASASPASASRPPPGRPASVPPASPPASPVASPPAGPPAARAAKRSGPRPAPPVAPTIETDASAEELRDLCEAQLETEPDPERKARLHYELGRLYEIDLADAAKAAEHYQSALRSAPDHAAAVRGARRVLAALGRHAALPALFDAEIETTRDPGDRARLLYAKARVMEEHLRQSGPALAVYDEALDLDPGNLAVLKAIERTQRRDKAWAPLAKTYERLANAVEDPALRAAWTAVRAHLVETHLDDPVQAAALYEAALAADPHATASLANVKRLSAAQKRWPQLIEALKREHGVVTDPATKLAILTSIAQIQERRLGDAEAAVATLEKALAKSPDEPSLLTELARLHREHGRHGPEVEALVRLVSHVEAKEPRARICHRIAHVYEQLLGDSDRALPWYERTLESAPRHRAAALSLARLHETHQRWAQAILVWEARASALSAPRERADLHHRIGLAFEQRLGQKDDATRHHQAALGLDPNHEEAFESLTRLLSEAGRWRELAELYERAVDRAPNGEEATAWLFRIGAILEDRLDDPAGALVTYGRILERDEAHFGALHASQRAALRAGEHARAVELILRESAITKDQARSCALRHRAATLRAVQLNDPSGAMRDLEAVLKTDPKHRPSLESLVVLLSDAGSWSELVAVEQRLLPLTSTAADRVRLHHRIGEVQETELGKDRDAIASYRLALTLDPDFEPAREALVAALSRGESYEELASALEERVARPMPQQDRAILFTELGALYEDRLGRRDEALAAYERALTAAPLHRPALDARERLLTDAKDWKRLTDVLADEAEALSDPFLKTQAALRSALILSEQQGAVGLAMEAFRPVFADRPDHIGALLAVEEIYARTRDDAGLAVTFEKMVAVVADPKAKVAALQELARTRAASGADTNSVSRRILQLSPDDPAALEALAAAAAANGERNVQLAMQARLASTAADPTVGAFHQTRVGEILLAEGDAGGALGAFRAALSQDPKSLAATRGLTRAARAAGDPQALRQAARYEETLTRDRTVALALLLEAATLRRRADDDKAAADDYAQALALEPGSEDATSGLRATLMAVDDVPRLIELLSRAANAASDKSRRVALHLSVAGLHAEARNDLPAAVAATERALTASPSHLEALSKLAAYLERSGQWARAVETLDQVIPKERDEALVESLLRLARIVEDHLEDPERAARSLRAALARDEDNEEALGRLVRLERAQGRDEESLRLAKKLIQVVKDDTRKADVLAELAELEKARGEPAAAAAAAYTAIGIQGPSGAAAKVYRSLIESAPKAASWDSYATGLMTYLERAKGTGGDVSATYRELARVFSDAHNRPDRAIATLREGVEACPADKAISLALVKALQQLNAHDKALAELRRSLALDVLNPRAWRKMADVVRQLAEPEGAAVVLAPLVALREATEDEQRIVRSRRVRRAEAQIGILSETGLEQIVDGAALGTTASDLVRALSDVFGKLEGIDYERWGVAKRDRIRAGEPHPVRAFADRIGLIFGMPEYDLFVTSHGSVKRAMVLSGSTPALLVPASIESARDGVLAYQLARPITLLSRHLHPLDHLDARTIERVLVAAARQYEPTFSIRPDDEDIEAETKRVGKAIGFFSRGRVQDAATSFAAAPTPDVDAWYHDIHHMAARAAMLVTDDLLDAIEANGGALGRDAVADDLARFWVSDPAMRFRRAVAAQI